MRFLSRFCGVAAAGLSLSVQAQQPVSTLPVAARQYTPTQLQHDLEVLH